VINATAGWFSGRLLHKLLRVCTIGSLGCKGTGISIPMTYLGSYQRMLSLGQIASNSFIRPGSGECTSRRWTSPSDRGRQHTARTPGHCISPFISKYGELQLPKRPARSHALHHQFVGVSYSIVSIVKSFHLVHLLCTSWRGVVILLLFLSLTSLPAALRNPDLQDLVEARPRGQRKNPPQKLRFQAPHLKSTQYLLRSR
jgi:hypothetical protein